MTHRVNEDFWKMVALSLVESRKLPTKATPHTFDNAYYASCVTIPAFGIDCSYPQAPRNRVLESRPYPLLTEAVILHS